METKLKLILDAFGKEKVRVGEEIAPHTSLKLGGYAKLFFVALTQHEIIKMVETVRMLKLPLIIFGTGSKIMVSDNGFDGVVIKNRTKKISVVGVKGKVSKSGIGVEEALVEVESGVSTKNLVEFLKKQNLLSDDIVNLPGSFGGNLFINANLQKRCKNIKVINQDGEIEQIEAGVLSLRKHIVLSAVLKLYAKRRISA